MLPTVLSGTVVARIESARWEISPNQIKADLDGYGIEQRRWAEDGK